jgi:pimeloyl-ACP methyl ester carboxylesterase
LISLYSCVLAPGFRAGFTVGVDGERFILLPGMGADGRLFGPQRAHGFDFEVPPLPIPEPADDLSTYAARVRDMLDLAGPCVIGGVSFGGMVACELAAICRPRCVLLIASCRSRAALPCWHRPARWISRVVPDVFIRRGGVIGCQRIAKLESLDRHQRQLTLEMFLGTPVSFLRRAGGMVLRWKGVQPLECPVHHIHGQRDSVIPIKRVEPDEIIPDGGHLINLTHADQVNRFIERHL